MFDDDVTVQPNFEFPALPEGSVDDTDLSGGQADLEPNEAAQVRLLLEHVLPDHLVVVIQSVDLGVTKRDK